MNFTGIHITCTEEETEWLIAELSNLSFDTFEETDEGFSTFCEEPSFDHSAVKEILDRYRITNFEIKTIPKANWNEQWEKNYDPVFIGDQIQIRAPFHPFNPNFPIDILITPKMSFGTGHHATTALMMQQMLKIDLKDKSVLDVGAGTGVLSVLASKLGAKKLLSTDIDEWSKENSEENFYINHVQSEVLLGKIDELDIVGDWDIVLANINKNVLLEEMSVYQQKISLGGYLLLSGFYVKDVPDLLGEAQSLKLEKVIVSDLNDWACLLLQRT